METAPSSVHFIPHWSPWNSCLRVTMFHVHRWKLENHDGVGWCMPEISAFGEPGAAADKTSSRAVCSIWWAPGRPRLYSENLSQNVFFKDKKQTIWSLSSQWIDVLLLGQINSRQAQQHVSTYQHSDGWERKTGVRKPWLHETHSKSYYRAWYSFSAYYKQAQGAGKTAQ